MRLDFSINYFVLFVLCKFLNVLYSPHPLSDWYETRQEVPNSKACSTPFLPPNTVAHYQAFLGYWCPTGYLGCVTLFAGPQGSLCLQPHSCVKADWFYLVLKALLCAFQAPQRHRPCFLTFLIFAFPAAKRSDYYVSTRCSIYVGCRVKEGMNSRYKKWL